MTWRRQCLFSLMIDCFGKTTSWFFKQHNPYTFFVFHLLHCSHASLAPKSQHVPPSPPAGGVVKQQRPMKKADRAASWNLTVLFIPRLSPVCYWRKIHSVHISHRHGQETVWNVDIGGGRLAQLGRRWVQHDVYCTYCIMKQTYKWK